MQNRKHRRAPETEPRLQVEKGSAGELGGERSFLHGGGASGEEEAPAYGGFRAKLSMGMGSWVLHRASGAEIEEREGR